MRDTVDVMVIAALVPRAARGRLRRRNAMTTEHRPALAGHVLAGRP
jgi:hypothetical protein